MEQPEKITLTDNLGMLKRGTTLFKAKSHKGVKIVYQEIDLEEYDKRVSALADKLAKMPEVDLMALLKDALYDIPLDQLENVEKRLDAEIKRAEAAKEAAKVRTATERTYRGTCVDLRINGYTAVELRH